MEWSPIAEPGASDFVAVLAESQTSAVLVDSRTSAVVEPVAVAPKGRYADPPTVGEILTSHYREDSILMSDGVVTGWLDMGSFGKHATVSGTPPERVSAGYSYGISWDDVWSFPDDYESFLSLDYFFVRDLFIVAKMDADFRDDETFNLMMSSPVGAGAQWSYESESWPKYIFDGTYNNTHVKYADGVEVNGVDIEPGGAYSTLWPTDLCVLNVNDGTYRGIIDRIGRGRESGQSGTWRGTICEVLGYYQKLTAGDRAVITAYLMTKHGIT